MCGRATLSTPPDDLREIFGLTETPEWTPAYNIAPTEPLAAIRQPGRLDLLRFGLIPAFAKTASEGSRFSNARSETVAKLPVYREAFRSRRCLVIVDGFFEWTLAEGKRKQPHLIRLADRAPFAFGALWGTWTSRDGEVLESCSIVTAPAKGVVASLHDRIPLILAADRYAEWLDPQLASPERLLTPSRVDELVTEPVSSYVNDARNKGPACVAAPIPPAQGSLFS